MGKADPQFQSAIATPLNLFVYDKVGRRKNQLLFLN